MKITLLSQKGGVGKTTTAVNLAAALAGLGKHVLLVDLDAQASASLCLGIRREKLSPSCADVLLSGQPIHKAIRSTSVPGLDLLTGSIDLLAADLELGTFRRKEQRLRQALEPVDGLYDFVFLDAPASLSLMPLNGLVACDTYLVVLMPQFLVLQGLDNFLATLDRLRTRVGARCRLLGLLFTQVDRRLRSNRALVDEVRARHGARVLSTEIGVNVRLAEAPSRGQTIFDYRQDSTGARAYRLLATEVLMRSVRRQLPQPWADSTPMPPASQRRQEPSAAPDTAPSSRQVPGLAADPDTAPVQIADARFGPASWPQRRPAEPRDRD